MKKFLLFIVISFFILTFFVIEIKSKKEINKENSIEKRSVFLSYIELDNYVKNRETEVSKKNIINILNNIKSMNFNMIIVHVRPFSDAIYESKIYQYSSTVLVNGSDPEYDILDFIIKESKKRNIEVHAWINPYRILNTTDISKISINNPAYKFINTNNIEIIENKGIFYNPASDEVKKLIIDGIEELVTNYEIDGIHFDDYFYPSKDIDLKSYDEYKKNGGKLSLEEFRYDNVTTLIKNVYDSIKLINENVLFGISPEGNIDNNYNNHYLDIEEILSKKGYIDYIMPQIYFGFQNETKPFINTVDTWQKLIKEKSIKFIPALAFYKTGQVDDYAKSGKMEWIENDDIIKRQVLTLKSLNNYDGFCLFRYDYLFNEKKYKSTTKKEINNVKQILMKNN